MPNGTYGGVRGRKTKVGRKLLRFPPTRLWNDTSVLTSPPRKLPLLNINELYFYGTNMYAYYNR